MNIGIRLHDTIPGTLPERLAYVRDQGFSCVHLALQKALPGFPMMEAPRLLTDALAAQVREAMAAENLQLAVLGCYLNLATPDPEALERTYAVYRAHIDAATAMGALTVGTETGAPNTTYTTVPECYTEESLQLLIDRLRPLVRYAEERGVTLAIEPVCRHIVSTPERAERVLDAIDSPNLRIILDAVNLLNPTNAAQADAIFADAIARMGDRIAVLHMKDYQIVPGKADVQAMACGLGAMDYSRLLRYAQAHPGIPMTLENTKPDNAEAARLYLETAAVL